MTFIPNVRATTLLLLLPLAAGCPMDDDTSEEGGVLQSFSILGTVGRVDAAVPSGDGVGTVWIAVAVRAATAWARCGSPP